MDPKSEIALALSGDIYGYNSRNWESKSYVHWNHTLLDILPRDAQANVYVAPQYALSKDQVTNDGENKTLVSVPDFCLLYLKGERVESEGIDYEDLDKVETHEALARHFRGDYRIKDMSVLVLCEVKALPRISRNTPHIREWNPDRDI